MINVDGLGVWDWLTLAAAFVGLVAAAWFVARVLRETGSDWTRNPFGRFLVQRKALLAALFFLIIFNRVGPTWWDRWQEPATAALMWAFALQTFVPYRLLMKAQREAHDNAQEATR